MIAFLLVCAIPFLQFVAAFQNNDFAASILKELDGFRHEQEAMKSKLNEQDALIRNLERQQDEYAIRDEHQLAKIDRLESTVQQLEEQLGNLAAKTNIECEDGTQLESLQTMPGSHQALGCIDERINLSCPNGGLINVTEAYYGQYRQTTSCNEGCCAPNPEQDCTELVAENNAVNWAYLKFACNNQTECDYVYGAEFINECEAGYIADYMLIQYSCLPDDDTNYVAFTARASETRDYQIGDIVLFDSAITNVGHFYNTNTSSFICPFDGVYSFSASYYSGQDHNLYADIMRDNEQILRGYAPFDVDRYTHGSSMVVAECSAGQRVWTRCWGNDDRMFASDTIQSHFSGFALYRYY